MTKKKVDMVRMGLRRSSSLCRVHALNAMLALSFKLGEGKQGTDTQNGMASKAQKALLRPHQSRKEAFQSLKKPSCYWAGFHRPVGYLIESENRFLQCPELDK
jgi:hypothetical protein